MSANKLSEDQIVKVMAETLKPIITIMEQRIKTRRATLEALAIQPLTTLPEVVAKSREQESAIIRAVIQEQEDLLVIAKSLFPDGI